MAKETAEQKLLKLIEKTDAQDGPAAAKPEINSSPDARRVYDSVRGTGLPSLALPSFLTNITLALKGCFAQSGEQQSFGLREVNRILILAVVVVAAFFSVDFSKGLRQLERSAGLFTVKETGAVPAGNIEVKLPSFTDMQEYIAVVNRRNIFQPFERKVVKTEEKRLEEELGITRVAEQAKLLKLVGVSWLDSSESASAMVENTVNGVTYFLRRGEKINDVTIKDIFAESIVVSYQGEEMEMKL